MKDFYFQKDKWWVSPYNFVDEVREEYNLPKKVRRYRKKILKPLKQLLN